jgi:hypothetical protein
LTIVNAKACSEYQMCLFMHVLCNPEHVLAIPSALQFFHGHYIALLLVMLMLNTEELSLSCLFRAFLTSIENWSNQIF